MPVTEATSPGRPGGPAGALIAAVVGAGVAGLVGCTAGGADEVSFDERSGPEKIDYMREVVVPAMRPLFQREDPERFADFDCDTCHGPDPVGVRFEMPAALYPLPLEDPVGAGDARDPCTTTFMLIDVLPTMADLLGRPRFDPVDAPNGVGCHGCHLVDDDAS